MKSYFGDFYHVEAFSQRFLEFGNQTAVGRKKADNTSQADRRAAEKVPLTDGRRRVSRAKTSSEWHGTAAAHAARGARAGAAGTHLLRTQRVPGTPGHRQRVER